MHPPLPAIVEDPTTSYWLKDAIKALWARDPVDAANDTELLADIMRRRAAAKLEADSTNIPTGTLGIRVLWDDVPPNLRVTEDMVRNSWGAANPRWVKRHLYNRDHLTNGCPVALPFRDGFFYRCSYQPQPNGYCKGHKNRATAPTD